MDEKPFLLQGNVFNDCRGKVWFNNDFDLSPIKRTYFIQNINETYLRGWKGHYVERRWFICTKGEVEVYVAKIEDLEMKNSFFDLFKIHESTFDVLVVPNSYATLIKQLKEGSILMAFSDYHLGISNDENLRWSNEQIKL
jgi:dTDP-4-dehydrorhamnose 3,5-epimerase-like enzyme